MVEVDNRKLIIDVELRDEDIQEEVSEREIKETADTGVTLGDEEKAEQDTDQLLEGKIKDTMSSDFIEDRMHGALGAGGMAMGLGKAAQNPMALVQMLGTKIPILGMAIAAALMIPEVIKMIVDVLTKPGGIFDRRFKRIIAKEQNLFLKREQQRRRELGLDQVITTTQVTSWNGLTFAEVSNNLKEVRENGISTNLSTNYKAIGGN